jgi:hypothetical protein
MELFAITVGFIAGRIVGRIMDRNATDRECELAYLSGHVDGYTKAVVDSGEVPA